MPTENDKNQMQKTVDQKTSEPQLAAQGPNWQPEKKSFQEEATHEKNGQSPQVNSNKTTPIEIPNKKN